MSEAKRDENRIATLLGVSNADGVTPLPFQIDSVTGRVLVDVAVGDDAVLTSTVDITSANIKAMNVTPVEVIAGETGKVVIVDQCLFSFTYDDTQYANGGAVSLVEETSGTVLTDGLSAGEVNGTADVLKQVSAKDCVRISDKGVFITNADAPFITGNSTIKLFIRYRLITL